jgi:hypothetical protein
MNKLRITVIIIVSALLIGFLGCSAMLDGVTPCYIDPAIGEYTEADMLIFTPYTSLWDAKRLNAALDYKHILNKTELSNLLEKEGLEHKFLSDSLMVSMAGAKEFQDTVFNPSGPIGLLIPTLFGGVLGSLIISKPGDKKRIVELETKLNDTKTV